MRRLELIKRLLIFFFVGVLATGVIFGAGACQDRIVPPPETPPRPTPSAPMPIEMFKVDLRSLDAKSDFTAKIEGFVKELNQQTSGKSYLFWKSNEDQSSLRYFLAFYPNQRSLKLQTKILNTLIWTSKKLGVPSLREIFVNCLVPEGNGFLAATVYYWAETLPPISGIPIEEFWGNETMAVTGMFSSFRYFRGIFDVYDPQAPYAVSFEQKQGYTPKFLEVDSTAVSGKTLEEKVLNLIREHNKLASEEYYTALSFVEEEAYRHVEYYLMIYPNPSRDIREVVSDALASLIYNTFNYTNAPSISFVIIWPKAEDTITLFWLPDLKDDTLKSKDYWSLWFSRLKGIRGSITGYFNEE